MNATPRLVIMAALAGLALSSCVSYDPYSYGYGYGAPAPVRSSGVYYESDYVAYPRYYSGYDYSGYGYPYSSGYGYGYASYPYSSFSLGIFGRPSNYSSGYYGHHRHHHDSTNSYSPPRTFRGAPLNAAAPATPNFGAPRQLPRASSTFRSGAPAFSAPSAPMPRLSRPAPSAPSRMFTPRSAPSPTPAPTPRSRITREPTTAATAPAASSQVAVSPRFNRFR